jgi:transcriptional regulator of acetoin/glycerol metabolism
VDRVLSVHLKAAAALAEAHVAALFVPGPERTLDLRAGVDLDQAGIDSAGVVWSNHEQTLREGALTRLGQAIVWPLLLDGTLVALMYLDTAHADFPEPHEQSHGRVLAERVRALERPRALGPYLAGIASPAADLRRQLEVVLRQVAGNVSAAARVLGVNRDTIYERAARLALDLPSFRPHATAKR